MSEFDGVAEEVETNDATPPWATEGTEDDDISVPGEDVSAAEPFDMSDVIEPAKAVTMTIKSVTVDKYTRQGDDDWFKMNLKPTLVVDEKGVDGKGRYKNKHFFPRILIAVNRKAFGKEFEGKSYEARVGSQWGDYNQFLRALGFPTNPAPDNDKKFRQSLVGRKIIVDITKDKRRVNIDPAANNGKGKWVNSDEYVNSLKYIGSPKAAAATTAEAAVS